MMYDEQEKQEQQNQPNMAQTVAKDAGKKVARQSKNIAKKAMKKAALTVLKLFGSKILILAAVVLIVIILLVAVVYVCKIDDGKREDEDKGNTPYVVSHYTLDKIKVIDDGSGNYSIGFKSNDDESKTLTFDEAVQEIINTLKSNGNPLKDYISKDEDEQREFIKKLIQVDICTKYPKLGDNGLQGCINMVKPDSSSDTYKPGESGEIKLSYVPYDTFKSKIQSNDSSVMNNYTLNDDGKIVVATDSSTEGKPIDLSTSLNKNALSFDYLWALLVTTDDKKFVENIADLALKSDVTITVFEKHETVTTYSREKYIENIEGYQDSKFVAENKGYNNESPYGRQNITETNTVDNKSKSDPPTQTTTQNVSIAKANTWIIDYNCEYTKSTTSQGTNDYPSDTDLQSEDVQMDSKKNNNTIHYSKDNCPENLKGDFQKFINNNLNRDNYYVEVKMNTTTTYSDLKFGQNTYTETTEYKEGTNSNTEKTDKDSEEDNFVTYLNNSSKALKELKMNLDWLEEMLEGNERADYMIDVTKYLMYKATGHDYGVTELNVEDIGPIQGSDFVNTSGEGFWWPIGSKETTEKDGKEFASGEPVNSTITSGVGPRWGTNHNGLDITAGGSVPGPYIIASKDGTVIKAIDGFSDNGSLSNEDGRWIWKSYQN